MRREQRKVGVVQAPQKIVERPFVNRCGLFPSHQHRKFPCFPQPQHNRCGRDVMCHK